MAKNSIEKTVNQAPLGLIGGMEDEEPMLEIEIEDPEGVKIGIDGLEIDLDPSEKEPSDDFNTNLADEMSEKDMASLVGDLLGTLMMTSAPAKIGSRLTWRGLNCLG